MKLENKILELIEKSGCVGIDLTEIKKETKQKESDIKKNLTRLREGKKIFRNMTNARWLSIKYFSKEQIEYNTKMQWCAG